MEFMKKMASSDGGKILRLSSSSSVLGNKFNSRFLKDKKKEEEIAPELKRAMTIKENDETKKVKDIEDEKDKEEEDRDSETLESDLSLFEMDIQDNLDYFDMFKKEIRIEVKAIEFDWILKSKEGEMFLENLRRTETLEYFEIDLIKDIIFFQWQYFLPRILGLIFAPFMMYFILFILYSTWILDQKFNEENNDGTWHLTSFILGICILVYQLWFVYTDVFHFNFTYNNFLDVLSMCINTAVIVGDLSGAEKDDINAISSVAVLLLWLRLFFMLRIFSKTSYLISMILAIIMEMRYFVLALVIAIFAFANTFFILGRNADENFAGNNVWDAFIFAYRMGLGDFDTDNFGTKDEVLVWIFWFINTLIILIILLNLVIAIMGDTFDRVQETQESTMLQEFCRIIRENEFLISRQNIFKDAKYIVIVQPEKAEGASTSWEGKLNQLKRFLEDSSRKHIFHLNRLEKKLERMIESGLEDKLKPLEEKINLKITALENRLQKSNKMFSTYPVRELLDRVGRLG